MTMITTVTTAKITTIPNTTPPATPPAFEEPFAFPMTIVGVSVNFVPLVAAWKNRRLETQPACGIIIRAHVLDTFPHKDMGKS
jgi:hypothetical protein